MNINDNLLFLFREGTPFEIWPQVVYPSQSAALTTPLQACILKSKHQKFYERERERERERFLMMIKLILPASFGTELQLPWP